MRTKKFKTLLAVGLAAVIVAAILIACFILTRPACSTVVSVSSYDGEATFTLDTSDDNFVEVKKHAVNGIESLTVTYRDEEKLIETFQSDARYRREFLYERSDGSTERRLLMLTDRHYFVIDINYGEGKSAQIMSLHAGISVIEYYPLFNPSIYVNFGGVGDEVYGGSETYTVDEFNAYYTNKMIDNAYTTYEELKTYYAEIDPDLYTTNDDEQTISVKIYSRFTHQNGTHYCDGYPVSIQFTEDGNVVVSLDLDLIFNS